MPQTDIPSKQTLPPTSIRVRAPAKINLSLHVTGQRADGYHLLDSLVVFACDAADTITLTRSDQMSLRVTGPFSTGVPEDARNLCWKAAKLFGKPVAMALDKHLPHAAGIGGGSSDAAAVLQGMEALYGTPFSGDASVLGADVPVCLAGRAQRMRGIGERVAAIDIPRLHAVLVNPGIDVPTPAVFAALQDKSNAPMKPQTGDFRNWLRDQRNDLQLPACAIAPAISDVLDALAATPSNWLVRMSGSGATCFGLYDNESCAAAAAVQLRAAHPEWWVSASDLV